MKSCMGGFCAIRDVCANYHAESWGIPSERLCVPGDDGTAKPTRDTDDMEVVRVLRPQGTWESKTPAHRRAGVFDQLLQTA